LSPSISSPQGNPADFPQLLRAVRRVAALRGRPPGTVVSDRGFGFAANDRARPSSASGASGCSAPARPQVPSRAGADPGVQTYAQLARGNRGASATSSARSGCGAPGCAAWTASGAWVGLGIFAYNLQRITVVG
jgi:IS5 family transposase